MTEQNKRIIELLERTGTVDRKTLQERLKQCYYESEPIITDEEYDELFGNDDYVGYVSDPNSSWEVLPHKIAMGSLEKIKTWDKALSWIKDKDDLFWQPKLDGLSIEMVYEAGILKHAILRGGGDKGEDVLRNAEKFNGVPSTIDTNNYYVSVRGEVVISKSNFDKLCVVSQNTYKNRRNCIPGICRRYDGQYADFLSFYAYDIITQYSENDTKVYTTYKEKLNDIYTYGFLLPFTCTEMTEKSYNYYGDVRDTAELFQMDGLVIKTNDLKHQIALKFEPKGEQTVVTGYSWEIGSTGKYVPKILFETVNVGGSNLSQAAIGSFQGYLDLNAPIGSKVEVRKMGDVIPKVTKVIEKSNGLLEIPTKCPHCGMSLQRQGADLYCVNPDCIIKQIDKCCFPYHAVKMKGVKETWIKELMKQGKIKKCYDVPLVKAEDIASIDGYSQNTANKLVEHLKKEYTKMYSTQDIKWFLCMLPIPTIAGKALDRMASLFETFDELETRLTNWCINDNQQLVDILGNAKGDKAYNFLIDNKEDILKLLEVIKDIALEEQGAFQALY